VLDSIDMHTVVPPSASGLATRSVEVSFEVLLSLACLALWASMPWKRERNEVYASDTRAALPLRGQFRKVPW